MKTRVEPHSCADEIWRVVPTDYDQIHDCSCGRIFKHVPRSWLRTFNPFRRKAAAISADLWVDVTRRERKLRERQGRRDGYITGDRQVKP